jgi:hypothetical protein
VSWGSFVGADYSCVSVRGWEGIHVKGAMEEVGMVCGEGRKAARSVWV